MYWHLSWGEVSGKLCDTTYYREAELKKRSEQRFPESKLIPEEFRMVDPIRHTEYLLDGSLRTWDGSCQEVCSPIWKKQGHDLSPYVIGTAPLLSPAVALEALSAAKRAYANGRGAWPTMSVSDRIDAVHAFTAALLRKRSGIIRLLMWETGKSLQEAEREFDRTVTYITDTINALKELDRSSSRFVVEQGVIGQIRRAPLGVVLCMGPYNFPLYETFSTLIPAVLMGNTILLKPPRFGILIFQPLLEAFCSSFPPGVVNTVYGDGEQIILPLMTSGDIDVLAFIGTSSVAERLRAAHPRPHRLRCVLGLDAKNPAIVLPDADLDLATDECIKGSLTFNGQRCTALKMIFVHCSIAEQFLNKFAQAVAGLKCGLPWEAGVTITPLPEPEKPAYLTGLVQDAVAKGARVVNAGGATYAGSFFYPAVLYPVDSSMRVYSEEQFGPVVPVVPYDDLQEVIDYVVSSEYGQQASIFGQSPDKVAFVLDALVNQVCRININSQCQRSPDTFPFNGRKNSAEGTQSIADALRVFSIRTVVAARENVTNRELVNDIVKGRKSHFMSTDYLL
jgi:glyceraldehyde-3-phosphate dehydrogenase (NADP+)